MINMITKEDIIQNIKSRYYFINPEFVDEFGYKHKYKTIANELSEMLPVKKADKERYLENITHAISYFGGYEVINVDQNLNVVDFGIFKIKIEINKLVCDLNTLERKYYIDIY